MNASTEERALREEFARQGAVLYARGLASGSAGNMSVLAPDGSIIVTPTGTCLGRLDPDHLSKVDMHGNLIDGPKPTKEAAFHAAILRNNPSIKAIVHLHSTYSTALACLKDLDPEDAIKPFTPYIVMKLGKIQVVPYYKPGSPKLAEELAARAAGHKGWLLANHGCVVGGKDLNNAVCNAEELEATAKLYFVLNPMKDRIRYLTDGEIAELS